jgi:hypothetical protein
MLRQQQEGFMAQEVVTERPEPTEQLELKVRELERRLAVLEEVEKERRAALEAFF